MQLTCATPHWHVQYPTVIDPDQAGRARSVMLINKLRSTNAWSAIHVPHPDVTAITYTSLTDTPVHIFNLYVDGNHDTAIHAAAQVLRKLEASGVDTQHVMWLGDFNRHHPTWDSPANHHLFTPRNLERAELLIHKLADLGLTMALPASIPTLEATRTKNLTRPDNVFCTDFLLTQVHSCTVAPERRPVCTDHFPILTTLDLPSAAAPQREHRDFRRVDWGTFDSALAARLKTRAPPSEVQTVAEFDATLAALMLDLQTTIEDHIPLAPDTPYAKQWWSKELTLMRREKERLARIAFHQRANPSDPAHAEYRRYRNQYADHIRAAKQDYWTAWINTVDKKTVWDANQFLKRGSTDGGCARIPPIKVPQHDGSQWVLSTNEEKSKEFYKTFFLPPGNAPLPEGPYPHPRFRFQQITDPQIHAAMAELRSFKAPGPDAIPNKVYRNCADTLAPHLGPLFRATFSLKYYVEQCATKHAELVLT